MLRQGQDTDATGRLVIDLPAITGGAVSPDIDVLLARGDRILIPRISQTVTVIGEVQHPTSHIFESNLDRNDYLDRSGGMKAEADKRRVYVVHANGSVAPSSGSRFFRRRSGEAIQPGDTIVVPLDADRLGKLPLWTSVSSIIYNIGVAAAAVASF